MFRNKKIIIALFFALLALPASAILTDDDQEPKVSLTEEVFTDKELKVLKGFADTIIANTTPDDIILFIGRSPFMIKHYFDVVKVNRTYFSAAFSGKPYMVMREDEGSDTIHPKDIEAYKEYANKLGLNAALTAKKGHIIFVDMIVMGRSIAEFATFFATLYPEKLEDRLFKFMYGSACRSINTMTGINCFIESFVKHYRENNSRPYYNNKVEFYPYSFLYNQNIAVTRAFPDLRHPDPKKRLNALKRINKLCPDESIRRLNKFYADSQNEDHPDQFGIDLGNKFGAWDFSLPGLCLFEICDWGVLDPFMASKTGNVDLVMQNAENVWLKANSQVSTQQADHPLDEVDSHQPQQAACSSDSAQCED